MRSKILFFIHGVLTVILGVVLCIGCPPQPITPSPDATDAADLSSDAADDAVTTVDSVPLSPPCTRACARLRALQCPEGQKVPSGQTCEEVCQHTLAGAFDLNPKCLGDAKTVAAVRACKNQLGKTTVKCAQ